MLRECYTSFTGEIKARKISKKDKIFKKYILLVYNCYKMYVRYHMCCQLHIFQYFVLICFYMQNDNDKTLHRTNNH